MIWNKNKDETVGIERIWLNEIGNERIEYVQIVRCKDCKHYDETQRGKPKGKNRYYVCDDFNPEDDWFCADGERKEGR